MDHEYDVLGGYLPTFVQHLKDTSARLGLRVDPLANEDTNDAEEGSEAVDSDAPTTSGWTLTERDTFFRALSVYSRWRPDLIAACVQTRSEWEVWMYLEVLEEGAAKLAATQPGGEDVDMEGSAEDGHRNAGSTCRDESSRSRVGADVDMEDDDEGECPRVVSMRIDKPSPSDPRWNWGSGSDTDADGDGRVCEPALEVTQAWIDAEERMAAWIVDQEHLACLGGDDSGDMDVVVDPPPKRKRGRPRGIGNGGTQSQAVSNDDDHSPSAARRSPSLREHASSRARKRSTSIGHEREALMGRLEVSHLMVLDNILREAEEAMQDRSKSREHSITEVTCTTPGNEGVPHARDAEVTSLSDRTTAPQGADDVAIDPVLLALSGGIDSAGNQSAAALAIQDAVSQPISREASSQPGTSNIFTFPLDSGTPSDTKLTANVELDLSQLSPRLRRRIQKRFHMRRKRAMQNGMPPEGIVNTGIERLKPGKKAKPQRRETSTVSTPVPRGSEAPSNAELELTENTSKMGKGGLTLPYKLKAQFAKLGVDAAYLRDEGMHLLDLSALGRMMGLYSSLEHGEAEADESVVTQFVDAELIRHLQAGMVSFVTDVIHRAIVWREREIRLKRRSQVWRQGDQVTLGAIEHAVEAVGARYRSHKEYFESVETCHDFLTEPSCAPATDPEPSPSVDPDVEAENPAADSCVLPLHRDVYTPLVRPPSAWGLGPLVCLARTYEREATRTRRGPSAEAGEDELLSDETDDDALAEELAEEAAADALDTSLAVAEEAALWRLLV